MKKLRIDPTWKSKYLSKMKTYLEWTCNHGQHDMNKYDGDIWHVAIDNMPWTSMNMMLFTPTFLPFETPV